MSSDTSEKALEACIERFLTGDVSTPAFTESPDVCEFPIARKPLSFSF